MAAYEYMVIPAPTKGVKAKGIKTVEGRFALALQDVMNKMGVDGWEYQLDENGNVLPVRFFIPAQQGIEVITSLK